MSKLFKTKELEKKASVYLEKDSGTWIKSIVSELYAQFPILQKVPIEVQWVKQDTAKGYAVGNIKILNGSVPVIIKDFQLAPLDIYYVWNCLYSIK
jgi:hypothetical protein